MKPLQNRLFLGSLFLFLSLASVALYAQENATDFQKQAALFSQKCSKCHTVGKGDRVGPDLKNVHEQRERKWLLGFIRQPSSFLDTDPLAQELLKKYNNVRMPDLDLTTQEAETLVDYITVTSEGPVLEGSGEEFLVPETKQVPLPEEYKGISTHGLVLVILFAGLTLFFGLTSKKTSALTFLVLTLAISYWSFGGRKNHQYVGVQQGYEPVQPISYSHELHAGQLQISCLYCHHGAEKSAVAGVPSINVCMNCHNSIQKESPDLSKLKDIWESRKTDKPKVLEWVRVHRVPDFVYFNHQAHVQNNISCQECHGPIEKMERVRQASDLTMGTCVNCHRHEGQPAPSHWKRAQGPLDCTSCHQ